MAIEKVREHLKQFGLQDKIMEFEVSSATVGEAAKAIGCDESNIVKTLSFLVDDRPILVSVAGNARIDNAKFKSYFKVKAKMIPFDMVEPLVGHGVGGVCPFGVKDGVEVYLDVSLKNFDVVYPAAGSSNSAVKVTVPQLEASSNFKSWVDVCK